MIALMGDWETETSELILWRQNGVETNGLPSYEKQILTNFDFEANAVEFIKFDDDDLIDIVFEIQDEARSPSGYGLNKYQWLKNLANNNFSAPILIAEDLNTSGQSPFQIADFNNDGLKMS